jgi:1-acyl-sn-glycerol-3-phosphate acyltransferase
LTNAAGAERAPWLARLLGWIASVFFHIERRGERIPDGPVLVTANHPNSLLDPLVVFQTAGRATRPLAKAPLFEQAFVGFMLRALGGLPVYRRQDDAAQMHRNDETFRRAIDALRGGAAVQIFPEGITHSEPGLAPLRTGAARIALSAEQESDWHLGLRVVPVGLTYRHKTRFRGRALASVGQPIVVAQWREAYAHDTQEAARALTETIAERLRAVTLDLTKSEDEALVETAERIWSREKGLAGWRERQSLAERLPRLQAFARGLAWLRMNDPARHETLAHDVRRYSSWLQRLGVHEGDVPPRYGAWSVLRYALREGLILLIGLPFALLGALLWAPVWFAPRITLARLRPAYEAISSYKLVTGFFAAPLLWIVLVAVAGWFLGWMAALGAAATVPLLGLTALLWGERYMRVRDDADLFLRVLRRPALATQLEAQRGALVRTFDELAETVMSESTPDYSPT